MKLIALLLLLCWSAAGQQVRGTAETKGACSPANTGNNNTFNITCEGIPDRLRAQLVDLLNRLAKNQTDAEAVMAKLDGCLQGVREVREQQASRHLSYKQRTLLLEEMRPFKGEKVTITATEGDPEAYGYAQDFVAIFRAAGFELTVFATGAETTGVNAIIIMGGAPITGVDLQPRDEVAWQKSLVRVFDRALIAAQVQHSAHYIGVRSHTDLEIYVGPKPRD
jgi:hypothetical protein